MIWLTILGMALITYFNRLVFLVKGISYKPSERVKQFLEFSGLAVLTAIWAPIVFQVSYAGEARFSVGPDYLIAAGIAAGLSLLKAHSLVVVIVSSAIFFALRAFYF